MSYVSGNLRTFENRLHQLPISTGDLASFRSEDDNYTFNTGQAQHINREYQRKYFGITRDASYLTGWYLGSSSSSQSEFNPANYGSSYSWYAARLENGFTDGQNISLLSDRGTAGIIMTDEGFASRQPRWIAGSDSNAPNGKPLFRFALDALVPIGRAAISTPVVAAVVYRSTSAGFIFGGLGSGPSQQGLRASSATGMALYRGATYSVANINGYDASGWQVCVFGFSPASANTLFFKSNMSQAASPNNFYDAGSSSSASSIAASSLKLGIQNWNGDIAEAIIWRSELTMEQRIEVGKKLSDIYGITY